MAISIDDKLRREYFELLPSITIIGAELEAKIRYALIPAVRNLKKYQQIRITSRIKDCNSSINRLRRNQEGNTFDRYLFGNYSLTQLRDLAGVRVLVFPSSLIPYIVRLIRKQIGKGWVSDPV